MATKIIGVGNYIPSQTITNLFFDQHHFLDENGVALKQIDFKNFTSKRQNNLYFVGEVLDVDAITGGFNFQHAWTSGFLVAQDLLNKHSE